MADHDVCKILVSDVIHASGLNLLEKSKGVSIDYRPYLTEEELIGIIDGYDGLLTGSRTIVSRASLDRADRKSVV